MCGHKAEVVIMTYSNEYKQLISSSKDGQIIFWG